jgi:AcrR family transcriptional regulator
MVTRERRHANTRARPGTRATGKRRSGEQTRAIILDHASRLFAQNGYDGVAVREVAEAVNLSVPAIYLYFEDKRQLYLECVLAVFARGTEVIAEALANEADPKKGIRAAVRALVGLLVEDPTLARLFQWELATADEEGLSLLEETAFRETVDKLHKLVTSTTGKQMPRIDIVAIFALAFGLVQYTHVGVAIEVPEDENLANYLAEFITRKMLPDL